MFQSKFVCVDCGRSTVKFVGPDGQVQTFRTLRHKIDLEQTLAMPSLVKRNGLVISYKDDAYAVGEFAGIFSDSISSMVDEDSVKQSVLYYLVAIAMVCEDADSVTLGLNLTFNTFRFKEYLRTQLKGNHRIGIYDFDKNKWIVKSFNIDKVGVVYQGWSALVAVVLDHKKNLKSEYQNMLSQEGIVFDFGRRTVDVVVIKNMTPVMGASFDFGTFTVYQKVCEHLLQTHSITKTIYEIENRHIKENKVNLVDGTSIDIAAMVREFTPLVAEKILDSLREYLYQQTPDYVYLVGGGAYLFGSSFKEIFKRAVMLKEPELLNVKGLHLFFSP